jgi:exopolysaccharide biosynthesis predicted pyruvyltransferase EpsI
LNLVRRERLAGAFGFDESEEIHEKEAGHSTLRQAKIVEIDRVHALLLQIAGQ